MRREEKEMDGIRGKGRSEEGRLVEREEGD